MEIIQVPLSKVEVWKKNLDVRATKKEGYDRTKKQIQKLDIFKPVTAYPENGRYFILGGRLRYFVIRDLGHKEIDISVVHPKNDAEKWEYVLADNDQPSTYIDEILAEHLYKERERIDLEDYSITVGKTKTIKEVLGEFTPDGDNGDPPPEEGEETVCPKCGFKWQK